jgi:hypothetical protein
MLLMIAAVELCARLPLRSRFSVVIDTARRAAKVVASPAISDHWKEKVLLSYAGRLAASALMLGLVLAVLSVAIFGAIFFGEAVAGRAGGILQFALSLRGIAFMTAVSLLYGYARFGGA